MDFLKKLDLTGAQFLKLIGLTAFLIVVLMILSTLFGTGNRLMSQNEVFESDSLAGITSMQQPSMGSYAEKLSIRNVTDSYAPSPTGGGYTAGSDAEGFEVKEYSAQIETTNLNRDCDTILALKSRTDVIFENASTYEHGCSYTFKVAKESVDDVLGRIKELDPKELTENSYTIKREVDDFTSEIQILEQKLASLDATLKEALASYTDVTTLATRTGDVESLAKIIDSKLTIIERLANARISTIGELERINRAKNESLDRLAYTYFNVSVYENKYADSEALKASWKTAVQTFVYETNALLQEMSIGLITLIFGIAKFVLYGFILLFVARFGWIYVRRFWNNAL